MNIDIGYIVLWFVAFLFSLTIHEAAHAWTSERFGDDTGRWMGRVSLNPAVHIDPLGTIIFPLINLITGSGFFFGWAKPVPVNPTKWSDHTFANIAVSGAGPASNILLALIVGFIVKALMYFNVITSLQFRLMFRAIGSGSSSTGQVGGLMEPVLCLLCIMLMLNISLAAFNMIPIPPLDGSHILSSLLSLISPDLMEAYESLRPYGFMILLACMVTGILNLIAMPFFAVVTTSISFILNYGTN